MPEPGARNYWTQLVTRPRWEWAVLWLIVAMNAGTILLRGLTWTATR